MPVPPPYNQLYVSPQVGILDGVLLLYRSMLHVCPAQSYTA